MPAELSAETPAPGPSTSAQPGRGRSTSVNIELALALLIAFGCMALLIAVVTLVVEPQPIAGLGASQRQGAETGLYLAAFAIVLPLALAVGPKLARVIGTGPSGGGLPVLTGVLAGALAVAIVLARLSERGAAAVLVGVGVWAALAALSLRRAAAPRRWSALLRIEGLAGWIWTAAGALWLAAVFAVVDPASLSKPVLIVGAVAAAAAVAVARRRSPSPVLSGRLGIAFDAVAIVAVGLAVPDLVVVRPEDPGLSALDRYVSVIMQFHQDFLVGPVNQMLGGSPMLVDTASQYGVGSIYFLAGWMAIAGVGYGTFALLDAILTGLLFVAGYLLLRIAGASRLLTAATLAVAVIALVYNRVYPVGALPQEGPFRFGLPVLVVLAWTAAARWPRRARAARIGAIFVVALSSLWALEAFAYTVFTFAALVGAEALLGGFGPASERAIAPRARLRWAGRQGLMAAGACVVAHLLFALATLIGTGQLPEWGQYLDFLHEFLLGGLGSITYDFSRWSAGLAVGAGYLAAAAALSTALRRRPPIVVGAPAATAALVGLTAYGVALFAYFVDRSADHVLVYVALPLVLIGALWLSLVLRADRAVLPRRAREGALAAALALAVILVSVAWSSAGGRFDRSALAHLAPGEPSTRAAVARLRAFPAINSASPIGAALLERHMPGERRSRVLTAADTETEILFRSGRSNRFPIAAPREDDFVAARRRPQLRDSIATMAPGSRLLVDQPLLAALRAVRRNPRSLLLRAPTPQTSSLQVWAMREIDRRFRLRRVARDRATGLVVLEVASRR